MRKTLLKNFHQLKLETPIFESTIRIEQEINDKPRTVTDYHFCRSQPKVRKNPHIAGLSAGALELLDIDYEGLLEDA